MLVVKGFDSSGSTLRDSRFIGFRGREEGIVAGIVGGGFECGAGSKV